MGRQSLFCPPATCPAPASEQEDSERGGEEGPSYWTHLPSALNLLDTLRLSNQLQPLPVAGIGAWAEEHGGGQREEIQGMKRVELPAHLYEAEGLPASLFLPDAPVSLILSVAIYSPAYLLVPRHRESLRRESCKLCCRIGQDKKWQGDESQGLPR